MRSLAICVLASCALATPAFAQKSVDPFRYDQAKRCLKRPQPGALALQSWLEGHASGVSWGIMRCEKLGPHNYSLHAEGRAIDWHTDRAGAKRLIDMLLASDDALARRMGVQGLIFNCRAWWG